MLPLINNECATLKKTFNIQVDLVPIFLFFLSVFIEIYFTYHKIHPQKGYHPMVVGLFTEVTSPQSKFRTFPALVLKWT